MGGLFKDSRAIVTRARERVKIIAGEEGLDVQQRVRRASPPLSFFLPSRVYTAATGHVHARDRDWQLARPRDLPSTLDPSPHPRGRSRAFRVGAIIAAGVPRPTHDTHAPPWW